MITVGPHTAFPALKGLPPLIKEQRRLEALIAPVTPLVDIEKQVRKDIVALLILADVGKGETVTCLGYDVTHCERAGQTSLNAETLTERVVQHGVDRDWFLDQIAASMDTAADPQWATVKPSKGARVREPRLPGEPTKRMAKATLKKQRASAS